MADHIGNAICLPSRNYGRAVFAVVTDAASPDVVVRVRGRVVPIRIPGTGVGTVAPVAPK